jgi:hypothetical protein
MHIDVNVHVVVEDEVKADPILGSVKIRSELQRVVFFLPVRPEDRAAIADRFTEAFGEIREQALATIQKREDALRKIEASHGQA